MLMHASIAPAGSSDHQPSSTNTPSSNTAAPLPKWLMCVMVFSWSLSNALLVYCLPTSFLAAHAGDRVATAQSLGKIASAAALLDIFVSPQLGRLSDSTGRRPILIGVPLVALLLRVTAYFRPAAPVLASIKLGNTVLTSTFNVVVRAALADQYRRASAGAAAAADAKGVNPGARARDELTGRLGLLSASSGAAYALGLLVGGRLVSLHLRLPYAASAGLVAMLALFIVVRCRESLPQVARTPFGLRPPALGFLRLFRSGPNLRTLSMASALQTVSMSMGDSWQVFAREIRGWDASQCGLYGSLSGLGHTATALLVRRSVRRLGGRSYTLLATTGVATTDLILGLGSTRLCFAALPFNWVGRTQGVALAARSSEVAAAEGIGQGGLAGDRQNMQALLKVFCPMLYGYLFRIGYQNGVPALPFIFASTVAATGGILVFFSRSHVWASEVEQKQKLR